MVLARRSISSQQIMAMAELRLFGRSAAPGMGDGVVTVLGAVKQPKREAGTPAQEAVALKEALVQALAEVEALAREATGDAGDMLAFQAAMLSDDELAQPAFESVSAGEPASAAWEAAMADEISGYRAGEDSYFSARAADLEDIRDRVLGHLAPGADGAPIPGGSVVVAADLPLSRFLGIDWAQGGAIVLTEGSPTSHVAMLARARRVPMVVGLGAAAASMAGREALVDAASGEVVLDPTEDTRAAFAARAGRAAAAAVAAAAFRHRPAVTKDGTAISVNLNAASADELEGIDPGICDGIGLVRTELMFYGPDGPPDEDAQYEAYRRILAWAQGRAVTIRTLDAGGDKPIEGVTMSGESNPFLGVRGIRLSLRHPALFQTQLRALSRAAAHGDLRVMLPMVTVPAELEAARTLLDEAMTSLVNDRIPAARPKLGIMIEVPAAAIAVDQFDADFFSIGSNDLTQYVTAAGRDIGAVADLADPLNPAVMRLIASVAQHGRETGREVSLCGDAGGEPRAIGALLRAGLRSLSVAPQSVAAAKQAIAAVDLREATP
jgi:phosphoenolpyruvate-protein phosphotransferase (PTS system enzyme I)